MKKDDKNLLIASVIVVLSKVLPYGSLFIYPISLLATWTHEMGHGLTALLSGGSFIELRIFLDTTGLAVTKPEMGNLGKILIFYAGYLTTSLLGFFMLKSRFEIEKSNSLFVLLGSSILFSQFFWVVELESQLLCGFLVLMMFTLYKVNIKSKIILNVIALTLCLDSLESIYGLFSDDLVLAGISSSHSDARKLSELSFVPESFWIIQWLAISALFFYYGIKQPKKKPDKSPAFKS